MTKRRTHCSIDKLPAELKETLTRMVSDNEWPADFTWPSDEARPGHPRYEDMVEYCRQCGFSVSDSAMGRWAKSMRTLCRMKQAGIIAREVMEGINDEKAGQSQKAVAEMMTAVIIDSVAAATALKPKELLMLCAAARDCANIAIKSDKYSREQVAVKAKDADKTITALAAKKKIDPETLKAIREQVYGIVQ